MIIKLKQFFSLDLLTIWQKKQIDPQILKKYTQVCVKILQSNIAKQDQIIQNILKILQIIIKQRQQLFQDVQRVLVNLIYQSQGTITNILVNFFSKAQTPQLQKLCTNSIINVVKLLIQKNLHAESSSIKNTKQFLSLLSQKIPKIFYNYISFFMCLYGHQSYILRNAISQILKNILKYFSQNDNDNNLSKVKQKFISTIFQRIYDKSSYCRTHVLQTIIDLILSKALPHQFLITSLRAGVDRLKDSSTNTRKKALSLISTSIQALWPQQKKQKLRNIKDIQQQIQILNINKTQVQRMIDSIRNSGRVINQQDSQQQQNLRQLNILKIKLQQYNKDQKLLKQQIQITFLINDVLDKVKILLSSKSQSDVIETIKLYMKFNQRKIQYCKQFMPHIRLLIFSKQKKIKNQVLSTFTKLHLVQKNNQQVSQQLIQLFRNGTPQQISALQQILQIIISQSFQKNIPVIKLSVFSILWHKFINLIKNQNQQKDNQKVSILTILRIVFNKDPLIIKQQYILSFLAILKTYVQQSRKQDLKIVKQIIKIISLQPKSNPFVDKFSRNLITSIMIILINTQNYTDQQWYGVCDTLLTCIFKISQHPQKVTQILIKKLHSNLLNQNANSITLAHFIFALSHCCLKTLIYLDFLQNKIKKNINSGSNTIKQNQQDQQQLDRVVGGVQAQIQAKVNQIQSLVQKMIQQPFIKKWVNIIQKIVDNLSLSNQLQIISVLSFSKFMVINRSYCEKNIKKLMDILKRNDVDSVIKNNIIITIGDLLHRFPNTVQKQGEQLYPCLFDKNPKVRKTTLTVITHLVLNDMIKIKNQNICFVAKLFQDQDPQIQNLVKQFFNQLNRKDPKYLFNIIPQALSRFSNINTDNNQKTFSVFMQNILPLMQKDKYSQSLIQKLIQRLSNSLNIIQIKNAAFCLSQINLNQKNLRKLIQNFEDYKTIMQTPQVVTYFKILISKIKKSSKSQLKNLAQELQQKLNNANQDNFNAQQIKKRNNQRIQKKNKKKGNNNQKNKNNIQQQGKFKNKKTNKKLKKYDSSEQQNQQQFGNQNQQIQNIRQNTISNNRNRRNIAKRNPIIQQSQSQQMHQ